MAPMGDWDLITVLRVVMPLIAVVCAIIFVPWAWFWSFLAPLPGSIDDEIDGVLRHNIEGIIVFIDEAGRPPVRLAAGWKDRDQQIPLEADTLFKIASISKLYIAAATVKLVHQGSLSLDDTLAELMPSLADRVAHAERITLRMLLQHRSGIPNFTDDKAFSWFKLPSDTISAVNLILDQPANFMPDARYAYSNTNYVLIGNILDSILGYEHQRYIREALIEPIGLTQTYLQLSDVDSVDVASGYYVGYEPDLKDRDYVLPGGSMVATAEDVGIFLRALVDGSLFNNEEQALYEAVYPFEHTGELPGYQTIARYHPDLDAVVVQFVNTNGGNTVMMHGATYRRIVNILSRDAR